MRQRFIRFITLMLLTFLGCHSAPEPRDTDVVATVNGQPILVGEFKTSLRLTKAQLPPSAGSDMAKIKENLIQQLIQDRLLVDEARRRNLQDKSYYQEIMWVFRTRELAENVRDSLFSNPISISPDSINVHLPKIEIRYFPREIVVDRKELADSLRKALDTGADFAELARNFSILPSAKTDGFLGELRPSDANFPKEYKQVLKPMRSKDISAVFPVQDLFAIVRADSIYPPEDMQQRRREAIRELLIKEQRNQAFMDLRQKLFDQAKVQNFPDKFTSLDSMADSIVVAIIDQESIPYAFLRRYMGNNPRWATFDTPVKGALKALDNLLEAALFRREAEKRGYDKDADYLARYSVQEQYALKRGLILELVGAVNITDEAIKKYYEVHPKDYKAHKQRNVRHIVVASKAQADSIYMLLKNGVEFFGLAREYSQDRRSASSGGALGFISEGAMDPILDKAVFSLALNQPGEPIQTAQGYTILMATDERMTEDIPLANAAPRIRQALEQSDTNERVKAVSAELRSAAKVEVMEDVLKGVQ